MAGTAESASQVRIMLSCNVAWWVEPYLNLAYIAALPFVAWASDEVIDDYCARHVAFCMNHGVQISVRTV